MGSGSDDRFRPAAVRLRLRAPDAFAYELGVRGSGVPHAEHVRRSGTFDAPHFGQIFVPTTVAAGPVGGNHLDNAELWLARSRR